MFALHETTRKQIARGAFIALCVIPTFGMAAWIGGRYLPGRTERVARALGARLDGLVELADWRSPRPFTVRTSGLTLNDRAGRPLVVAEGVESRDLGSRRALVAERVAVGEPQLPTLCASVPRWLAGVPQHELDLHVAQLALSLSGARGSDFVVAQVRGKVGRNGSGGLRMALAGRPDGRRGPSGPGVLRLAAEASADHADEHFVVTLEVVETTLPAACLKAFVPGFGKLGPDAAFCGSICWSLKPGDSRVSATGTLEQVDFAEVLPAGSQHRLEGTGTIQIKQWAWRNGKIERLAGAVNGAGCKASRSLLDAAVSALFCQQASRVPLADDPAAMQPLELLAFRFELDRRGLKFFGECPIEASGVAGCIAAFEKQPLLIEPPYESFVAGEGSEFRFHVAHLVQALAAPTGRIALPASAEAIEIAEPLPLPEGPRRR
ncbi:MAG: hypothetical protein IT424_13055 [Pirellulales bacterium]|nr:hypothetical protein [Pirellulales bacterium]